MSLRFEGRAPWGVVNDRMRAAAGAAAVEMAQEGQRFIKEAMQAEGKKDTGLTAQAVKAEPVAHEVAPGVMRCVVASSPQQAAPTIVLELGRKPGKGVSRAGQAKIRTWIRRKGRALLDKVMAEISARRQAAGQRATKKAVMEEALDTATFLVVRAIRRRGLKEFRFFRRARAHVESRAQTIWRRVLGRFGRGAVR